MDHPTRGIQKTLLLALYAALVVAIDAVGLAAEVHAVGEFAAGHPVAGLWYLVIGAIGIVFVTYAVGYGQVFRTLRG